MYKNTRFKLRYRIFSPYYLLPCQLLQLKGKVAEELQACVEEAQKQERELKAEELQSLREELQEKHEVQLLALKAELEKQMEEEQRCLEKQLQEEREKLKSQQAALDNDESKRKFGDSKD